jgi:hypothetical protein
MTDNPHFWSWDEAEAVFPGIGPRFEIFLQTMNLEEPLDLLLYAGNPPSYIRAELVYHGLWVEYLEYSAIAAAGPGWHHLGRRCYSLSTNPFL